MGFVEGVDAIWPDSEDTERDGGTADLLIVSGTSLTVSPANSVLPRSGPQTPKLLINRELVGEDLGLDLEPEQQGQKQEQEDKSEHTRESGGTGTSKDVFVAGDADDGFIALAAELGWLEELSAYSDQMADDSAVRLRAAMAKMASTVG